MDAPGGDDRLLWRSGRARGIGRPLAEAAYPNRTIKMIVPYPAGGTIDLLGRLVADQLRVGLAATVVVENKPGAATVLGAEQVARSEADGYTLLTATSTTLAINKALYRKLAYDPVADFTPIAPVARVPFALIVNPSLPAKTLSGIHGLRQRQSGARLRFGRQRQSTSSRCGNVAATAWNRRPSRVLSQQRSGAA